VAGHVRLSSPRRPARGFAQEIGDQVLPVEVHRENGHPVTVSMDQSPRPSRIQVTVSGPQVRVTGSGLVVAEGGMRG
jgi:hypothetical protein